MTPTASPKLRLSYSFLLLWSKGKHEEALNLYFHRKGISNEFIEDGKRIHQKWGSLIEKDKKLNVGQTTLVFEAPKVEHAITVSYNERFDLKGVFDCLDVKTLYEWKTGKQDLSFYMNSYQVPLYFLIAELSGLMPEKAVILLYNQHVDRCDVGVIWNSQLFRDSARNFIDSVAPDIYEYFIKHKLPFTKPL